jgi:putative transposase
MKYVFIEKNESRYPIKSQCQALGVSRGGYYVWQAREKEPGDKGLRALLAHIRRIHHQSRRTYGSPRVCAERRAQ